MALNVFTIDFSEAKPEDIPEIIKIIEHISFAGLSREPGAKNGVFHMVEKEIPGYVKFPPGCRVYPVLQDSSDPKA